MVIVAPTRWLLDIWPEFQTRDFADPLAFPDVTFAVERYGWHAIG